MKKFITLMSFSHGESYKAVVYAAINNSLLSYDKPTRFPIVQVINAYAKKDEEIEIICVIPDHPVCWDNYHRYFLNEIEPLAEEKGFKYKIIEMKVANSPNLAASLDMFQKLLDELNANDTIYACLTYGLKTMPIVMLTAIQYAYYTFQQVSVDCIVYGEFYNQSGRNFNSDEPAKGSIHDVTALIQINELARLLAEQKAENPKEVIKQILQI